MPPVRFGEFEFDQERRELTRSGSGVHLSPKAFDLLALLIDQAPKALRREEIYDRLWSQTFVDPANIDNLISEIRQALEDRDHTTVTTKRRYGFAFSADVVQTPGDSDPRPRHLYRLVVGKRSFDLSPGRNLIGRDLDCQVILDSPSVSRHHAAIEIDAAEAVLHDLGSRNGTFVRHERVRTPIPLRDGDEIQIGRTLMRIRIFDRRATTISDPE